jgi:hypothetical protein
MAAWAQDQARGQQPAADQVTRLCSLPICRPRPARTLSGADGATVTYAVPSSVRDRRQPGRRRRLPGRRAEAAEHHRLPCAPRIGQIAPPGSRSPSRTGCGHAAGRPCRRAGSRRPGCRRPGAARNCRQVGDTRRGAGLDQAAARLRGRRPALRGDLRDCGVHEGEVGGDVAARVAGPRSCSRCCEVPPDPAESHSVQSCARTPARRDRAQPDDAAAQGKSGQVQRARAGLTSVRCCRPGAGFLLTGPASSALPVRVQSCRRRQRRPSR